MECGRWTVNALPQQAGHRKLEPGSVKMSQGCSRERKSPSAVVIIASELGSRDKSTIE